MCQMEFPAGTNHPPREEQAKGILIHSGCSKANIVLWVAWVFIPPFLPRVFVFLHPPVEWKCRVRPSKNKRTRTEAARNFLLCRERNVEPVTGVSEVRKKGEGQVRVTQGVKYHMLHWSMCPRERKRNGGGWANNVTWR